MEMVWVSLLVSLQCCDANVLCMTPAAAHACLGPVKREFEQLEGNLAKTEVLAYMLGTHLPTGTA